MRKSRYIGGEFVVGDQTLHIFNGYFPQGESRDHAAKFPAKIRFYEDLNRFLGAL